MKLNKKINCNKQTKTINKIIKSANNVSRKMINKHMHYIDMVSKNMFTNQQHFIVYEKPGKYFFTTNEHTL